MGMESSWDLKNHYQSGQFANVLDSKLFYISRGKGDKVVLLPGLMACSYSYRKVIEILAENYNAISLDLPGTGFSEKPSQPYSHRLLARVLADFLEQIAGDEKVHLVAHDYAGPISFLMVNEFPEKVKSLSILSSYLNIKRIKFALPVKFFRIPFIGKYFTYLFFPSILRLVYNLFLHSSSRPMSQEVAQDYYSLLFEGDKKLNLAALCSNIDRTIYAQRDMEAGLKKMVGLRQIIQGSEDRLEDEKQTEYLMEIIRLSGIQRVDAGHMAMEEAPLSFAKKIEPLLESMNRHANKKQTGEKPWISSQAK
jgi:pimeloyl-ACP methyl ester carboxylesterase